MALTLNQFVGFETGGLEEVDTTVGSPDATEAVIVRSGARSLLLPSGGTNNVVVPLFDEVPVGSGDFHIFGFGVYFDDIDNPSSVSTFLRVKQLTDASLSLRLNTSGNMEVRDSSPSTIDTVTSPFKAATWHYVEVYFEHVGPVSGDWEIFIDGVSVSSGSDADFIVGTGDITDLELINFATSNRAIYYDDVYWLSGVTSASDRLGTGVSVLAYQGWSGGTSNNKFDKAGVEGGDNFDNGNWPAASQLPWNEGSLAAYRASGTLEGCDPFDTTGSTGSGPGPNSGTKIVSGTIKGAKFAWRADRSGGGGTTQEIIYGKYSGGGDMDPAPQVDTVTLLNGTLTNFFRLTEAADTVPTASENFVMGFANDGGKDFDCYEMQAFLLHVSDTTITDLSDGLMPEYPSPGLTVEAAT